MSSNNGTIRIDGQEFPVRADRHLLEVALELGLDLPYFCWHPALGSVGACRQCAVTQYQDDKDERGRVVMACMTPCGDGNRFAIDSADAREMRQSVIEFLMTNHPHDCPVCEEGGHCHLQDMTVLTGHAYRRYRHSKRSHRNQDLGPFISHEMNRCIACYRCVRYYREYAGGTDLNVFGTAANVYFGRAQDGTLASEFAGNLVEVCPTGVFTDKPLSEHYTRKWDLQQAPSICPHCSVGCNTLPGERYGRIKRIENRYHGELNGYFLCDRGRYGYGYTNAAERPTKARDAQGQALNPSQAIAQAAEWLGEGAVAAIGSSRASVESNFALRQLVGVDHFYRGEDAIATTINDAALALLSSPQVTIATPRAMERADAALVLGEDLLNTAARLALSLRQMTRQRSFELAQQAHVPLWQDQSVRLVAQQQRSPLFLATPGRTGLEDVAQGCLQAAADELVALGFAIAHALDPQTSPAPADLDPALQTFADQVATALRGAQRPLLVSGAGCREPALISACAAIARAWHASQGRPLDLSLVLPEANSAGTALLGGEPLESLLTRVRDGAVKTLLIAETDLYRWLSAAQVDDLLQRVSHCIVLDSHPTATSAGADLWLPAASVFEADGSLVNHAGLAQRHFQVFAPNGDQRASWVWLQALATTQGIDLGTDLDTLIAQCTASIPALAGLAAAAPDSNFRVGAGRIPRQPHRYSGRTAMHADRSLHEPQAPADHDTALNFSMEGTSVMADKPAAVIPLSWVPRWNSIQSVNKFQAEIGGALRGGDPGVSLLTNSERGDIAAIAPKAAPTASTDDRLIATPLHHLFGSEELSAAAPAIQAQGLPSAYLALHSRTAAEHGLAEATECELRWGDDWLRLPLQRNDDLGRRVAGLPRGVAGIDPQCFGQPVQLRPTGSGR